MSETLSPRPPLLLDDLPAPRVATAPEGAIAAYAPGGASAAAAKLLAADGRAPRRRDILDSLQGALAAATDAELLETLKGLPIPGNPKCKSCFGKGRIVRQPRPGELDGVIKTEGAGAIPASVKANIKVEDECHCVTAERTAMLRRERERRARPPRGGLVGGAALTQPKGLMATSVSMTEGNKP